MSRYFSDTQRYRLMREDIDSGAADPEGLDEAESDYMDMVESRAELARENQLLEEYEQ